MQAILTEKHSHLLMILLIIIIICNSCTIAPGYDENGYAKNWLNLNGKVKSACYINLMNNDNLLIKKSYRFDKFGRLIEENTIDSEEEFLEVYKLSSPNKLIDPSMQVSSLKEFSEFKNGIQVLRINYKDSLDAYGRLVKQTRISDFKKTSSTDLTYSLDGNLLSTRSLNFENGEVVFEFFTIDENNTLREKIYIRNDKDSIQERKIIKRYDARGNIILSESHFKNDRFHNKEVYLYNSLGKIIQYKSYGRDTMIYGESFISYDDSTGLKTDSTAHSYWWSNDKPSKYGLYQRKVYTFTKDEKLKELTIKHKDSLLSRSSYVYDKERNLTKNIVAYNGGRTIYYYDKMNQINKTQVFDRKGSMIEEGIIKMTYDAQKNIIRKTRLANDTIKENFRVKIEYY